MFRKNLSSPAQLEKIKSRNNNSGMIGLGLLAQRGIVLGRSARQLPQAQHRVRMPPDTRHQPFLAANEKRFEGGGGGEDLK